MQPDKCQAVIIGIGATGGEVVRQYLREYGVGEGSSEQPAAPRNVSVLMHVDGPEGPSSDPANGIFRSHDEHELLRETHHAIARLLGDRPIEYFGHTYYLDVFVCGAWKDEDFRYHLPLILPFLERTAHDRYSSIFTGWDDIRNSRFLVHPLGLSCNMPREDERDEIARLLGRIEAWHRRLQEEALAVIPRLFLYDGFTSSIQLDQEEIVDITANLMGLCTSAGVRTNSEIRRMLNFNAYSEDFFSVLNLATIHFPRKHFRDQISRAIARSFYELLLSERHQPEDLPAMVDFEDPRAPIHPTDRTASGYIERIHEDMHAYAGSIDPDSPPLEPGIRTIHAAAETFPAVPQAYAPETLERFFDRSWLLHLIGSCYPRPGSGVAGIFQEDVEQMRERWIERLTAVDRQVDEKLGTILGSGSGANFSLRGFCAALNQCDWEAVPAGQEGERALPGRRWRFSALRDVWVRMRRELWNFVPGYALTTWIPAFAVFLAIPLLAVFRYGRSLVDPSTVGARMLADLDASPFLLPVLMALGALLVLPVWTLRYFVKRTRLKRFLNPGLTGAAAERLSVESEDVIQDETPALLDTDPSTGIVPAAGTLMAFKTGLWWHGHGVLGARGLVRGLVRVVGIKVRAVREDAERVLDRVEQIAGTPSLFETPRPRQSLYFHDYLLNPEHATRFGEKISRNLSIKLSARSVATRLRDEGIDVFLQAAADPREIFRIAETEVPFFESGSVFRVPAFEDAVRTSLGRFLRVLPDRLSHGQIFHFLAAEEEDRLIENTSIVLIHPEEALAEIQLLLRDGDGVKTIQSKAKDHIWALRMVRDVSVRSVMRYLHFDKDEQEIERMLQDWKGDEAGSAEPRPWDELREASWTAS